MTLNQYYAISTQKFRGIMIVCGLCVVGYWTTVNGLFIVAYVVSMILLSLKRPTLNLLIEELKLNEEDRQTLIDNSDID